MTSDRLVVAQQRGPARVFSTNDFRLLSQVCRAESLNAVAVHENRLICAGPTLSLWDIQASREIRLLSAKPYQSGGAFGSVRFSPSGRWLASITANEDVFLWDTTDWHVVRKLRGPTALYGSVAFSPDGERLATSGHQLQLWEVATGRLLHTFDQAYYTYGPVEFSPDGSLLAAGAQDDSLRIWEVSSGKLLMRDSTFNGYVEGTSFDPTGRYLLVSGKELRVFDLVKHASRDLPSGTGAGPVTFLSDGTRMFSAAPKGHFTIWRTSDRSLELRR